MPRYYFDLRTDGQVWPDDEGTELDSLEAAQAQVREALPLMAAQRIRKDGDHAEFEMIVRDDQGADAMRATVSFRLSRA